MLAEFAELFKVDFVNVQARFLGFAKVKTRLHLGKDLPDLRYFYFGCLVYPIRFNRIWDICAPSGSSWGLGPFSMGSYSYRDSRKPYGK